MRSAKAADSEAFIADASVGIAWSVVSQATPAAGKLRDRIEAGTSFLVPVLWPLEVANALLMLLRRSRLTSDEFARARPELATLLQLFQFFLAFQLLALDIRRAMC